MPNDYLHTDADAHVHTWATTTSAEHFAAGQATALALFHDAARRVPAYAAFLREHGLDPATIRTAADWARVPIMDKDNYLARYPLADCAWDGDLNAAALVHSSSGTSGKLHYWCCGADEMQQAALLYEAIFRHAYQADTKRTLLIVCFGMGTWVAGSYTTSAAQWLRAKGLPLTTVTPGFNKAETLQLLQTLAPNFEQVVLAGIPSFVKDLLETWANSGAPRVPVKLFLAGEAFPETWRDYVANLLGGAATDIVSILGSADAGLIGFESAQSIAARDWADDERAFGQELFGSERVPALLHYVPILRHYEAVGGELLLTANRVLPLIRYNTHDLGGVLPSEALRCPRSWAGQLPLVYVFGRGHWAATLYGANIHAEYVQEVLLHPDVAKHVTGRMQLETTYTDTHAQRLLVHVEARATAAIATETWSPLLASILRQRSTEYARIWQEYGEAALPEVRLYPPGDPTRFGTTNQRKYG